MKFMISFNLPTSTNREAIHKFLANGAPAPEGMKVLGRWHAPGGYGWVLVEADDLGPVMTHAAQWSHLLEIETTPVLPDVEAAEAIAKGIADD